MEQTDSALRQCMKVEFHRGRRFESLGSSEKHFKFIQRGHEPFKHDSTLDRLIVTSRRRGTREQRSPSELLVDVFGIIHQFAACEVLAVLKNLVQLQTVVLVLVSDGDHLPSLVQCIVLVHRVHVLLREKQRISGAVRGNRAGVTTTKVSYLSKIFKVTDENESRLKYKS